MSQNKGQTNDEESLRMCDYASMFSISLVCSLFFRLITLKRNSIKVIPFPLIAPFIADGLEVRVVNFLLTVFHDEK